MSFNIKLQPGQQQVNYMQDEIDHILGILNDIGTGIDITNNPSIININNMIPQGISTSKPLTDVDNTTPPTNNDGLVYNSTSSKWEYIPVVKQSDLSPWSSDGTSWLDSSSVVINGTNSLFGSNQIYPFELNTGQGILNMFNNSGTNTSIDVSDVNATYINTLDLSN